MQRPIGSFRLDCCMQVTEMKNDIQNMQREASSTPGRQAGTAGFGRRFGEQGQHGVTGEDWACAE